MLRETAENYLKSADPIAWLNATPEEREQWVQDELEIHEAEENSILMSMPKSQTGDFVTDAQNDFVSQSIARELAQPVMPTAETLAATYREVWTNWAKKNRDVAPTYTTYLIELDKHIPQGLTFDEVGPTVWNYYYRIAFEDLEPSDIESAEEMEWDFKHHVIPTINFRLETVREELLDDCCPQLNLTQDRSLEEILQAIEDLAQQNFENRAALDIDRVEWLLRPGLSKWESQIIDLLNQEPDLIPTLRVPRWIMELKEQGKLPWYWIDFTRKETVQDVRKQGGKNFTL